MRLGLKGPMAAALALLLAGCGSLMRQSPVDQPGQLRSLPIQLSPLPGGLDPTLLLHSNSPERIEAPGIVLSTLERPGDVFLNRALSGSFSIFLHHVLRTPVFETRRLWIGLLAHNPADRPVRLKLRGNAFFTAPDAPFIDLPPLVTDRAVWSGPGDRVAYATLRGEANVVFDQEIAPGADLLIGHWQPVTNPVWFLQQDNALSALLDGDAGDALRFSVVALSQSALPVLKDYTDMLASGQRAGPAEADATSYDPLAAPAGGDFRYGRVAGLAKGARWRGEIAYDAARDARAYPISSVYLKRLGTNQNQSAPLIAKVPGTAAEAHANYGVCYKMQLGLSNSGISAKFVSLSLQQPLRAQEGQAEFRDPPLNQTMFRGSLKLTLEGKTSWHHLTLRNGQQAPAFAQVSLAPGQKLTGELAWIYPADATPPQMLLLKSSN